MRDNSYLIDFYSHYDEEGRLASRHGSVEFLTTMRYIEKYLKPEAVFWKSEPGPDGTPTAWPAGDFWWTRWSW